MNLKDEISWRLMKLVREDARRRGIRVEDMTDEQMCSVFKRHSRRVSTAVRHEMGIA